MTGPVFIGMSWSCGVLRQLAKPSFVLEDRLSPHHKALAVPNFFALPLASTVELSIALSDKVDSCGPLMTAACISSLVSLRTVLIGQPPVEYSSSVSYAG